MPVQIHTVVSDLYAENAYIAWLDGQSECIVVDPGFDPDPILDRIRQHKLTVAAILNTHGHVDHIAGNAAIKHAHPAAPLIIGHGDALMLTDPMRNLSGLFGLPLTSPPADRTVSEGQTIDVAGMRFSVWEIPGHSPGHVVFYCAKEGIVFGGDVLFAGSIGRTDFPGGSLEQLLSGIRAKLWPLPDETIVYPGHNEPTTIGQEKRTNPFLT